MKVAFNTTQKIFLLTVPFVTGSAIAILPAQAATFSLSEADAQLDRFSLPASSVFTATDTDTSTIASNGRVNADANAAATLSTQSGSNFSFSQATGEGAQYFGVANSTAQVIGSFLILNDDAFSFHFNANLSLQASADNPQVESVSAFGGIFFRLFNDQTGSLLDSFELSGLLDSQSNRDPFSFNASRSVQATLTKTLLADGTYIAQIDGTYSRSFDVGTSLGLEETKINAAQVAGVPEPSEMFGSFLALVLGSGFMLQRSRRAKTALPFIKQGQ